MNIHRIIIHNSQKSYNYLSVDEWAYTSEEFLKFLKMEYYSPIKKNGILIPATIWVNSKNMLNEKKNQTQELHLLHYPIYMKCSE